MLLSGEGVPVATSAGLPPSRAEQLAAIGAGLLSLADGAGRSIDTGNTRQVIIEMAEGVLLAAPIAPHLHLALLATKECNREQLGYELYRFTVDMGPLLGIIEE